MLKTDVIAHFGSQAKVARALIITETAVSLWKEIIPEGSAYKIESLTKGALKVDPTMYSKSAVHGPRTDQAPAS
jgi:DNA-binding transcriptional regulator YdaS (Cro superfamily)